MTFHFLTPQATLATVAPLVQPAASTAYQAPAPWAWAGNLLGVTSAQAGAAATVAAATPQPTSEPNPTPTEITRPVALAAQVAATSVPPPAAGAHRTVALLASGSIRASAIPTIKGPRGTAVVARGQSTYRQVAVSATAAPRTITVPPTRSTGAAKVEVFAVQPHRKGKHVTQVLVPVSGTTVRIPKGATVRFVVRVTGRTTGRATVDAGVTKLAVKVAAARVAPLPMLAWVNSSSATSRGASVADVERTLAGFGVASSGAVTGTKFRRAFANAAWEIKTNQPLGPVVDRILATEREHPGTPVWVQVVDEQDQTATQAARTASRMAALRAELERRGSTAKLFAACQPRPHTMAYAASIDGWAITQSDAGQTRAASIKAVQAASSRAGHAIELMEYPGNAFFDGATPSSGALSTASAALDGAKAWFTYSANNLDVLESGSIAEERGDVGGLVAIRKGEVLPTLALAEAHYGANLGAAARAVGGEARTGAAAMAIRSSVSRLDTARSAPTPDLLAWERTITARLK